MPSSPRLPSSESEEELSRSPESGIDERSSSVTSQSTPYTTQRQTFPSISTSPALLQSSHGWYMGQSPSPDLPGNYHSSSTYQPPSQFTALHSPRSTSPEPPYRNPHPKLPLSSPIDGEWAVIKTLTTEKNHAKKYQIPVLEPGPDKDQRPITFYPLKTVSTGRVSDLALDGGAIDYLQQSFYPINNASAEPRSQDNPHHAIDPGATYNPLNTTSDERFDHAADTRQQAITREAITIYLLHIKENENLHLISEEDGTDVKETFYKLPIDIASHITQWLVEHDYEHYKKHYGYPLISFQDRIKTSLEPMDTGQFHIVLDGNNKGAVTLPWQRRDEVILAIETELWKIKSSPYQYWQVFNKRQRLGIDCFQLTFKMLCTFAQDVAYFTLDIPLPFTSTPYQFPQCAYLSISALDILQTGATRVLRNQTKSMREFLQAPHHSDNTAEKEGHALKKFNSALYAVSLIQLIFNLGFNEKTLTAMHPPKSWSSPYKIGCFIGLNAITLASLFIAIPIFSVFYRHRSGLHNLELKRDAEKKLLLICKDSSLITHSKKNLLQFSSAMLAIFSNIILTLFNAEKTIFYVIDNSIDGLNLEEQSKKSNHLEFYFAYIIKFITAGLFTYYISLACSASSLRKINKDDSADNKKVVYSPLCLRMHYENGYPILQTTYSVSNSVFHRARNQLFRWGLYAVNMIDSLVVLHQGYLSMTNLKPKDAGYFRLFFFITSSLAAIPAFFSSQDNYYLDNNNNREDLQAINHHYVSIWKKNHTLLHKMITNHLIHCPHSSATISERLSDDKVSHQASLLMTCQQLLNKKIPIMEVLTLSDDDVSTIKQRVIVHYSTHPQDTNTNMPRIELGKRIALKTLKRLEAKGFSRSALLNNLKTQYIDQKNVANNQSLDIESGDNTLLEPLQSETDTLTNEDHALIRAYLLYQFDLIDQSRIDEEIHPYIQAVCGERGALNTYLHIHKERWYTKREIMHGAKTRQLIYDLSDAILQEFCPHLIESTTFYPLFEQNEQGRYTRVQESDSEDEGESNTVNTSNGYPTSRLIKNE